MGNLRQTTIVSQKNFHSKFSLIFNFRFTVLWLVPVRFVVKLPKLKPEKRRRRKLDVLNVEFNITEDSLTLFKPSVADVDPTQIHKNMCFWNVHEKSCAPFQLNKKDARQFYSYYINSLNEKTHLERNNFLEKEKKLGSSFAIDPAIVHW